MKNYFAKTSVFLALSLMSKHSVIVNAQNDPNGRQGYYEGVRSIQKPELGKPGEAYDWVDDHKWFEWFFKKNDTAK